MNCLPKSSKTSVAAPSSSQLNQKNNQEEESGEVNLIFSSYAPGKPLQKDWHEIAKNIEKYVTSVHFERVFLHNNTLRTSFKLFCEAHLCDENIMFYEAVEEFASLPSTQYAQQTLLKIRKWMRTKAVLKKILTENCFGDTKNFDMVLREINAKLQKVFRVEFKKTNEYREALQRNCELKHFQFQEWIDRRYAHPEFYEFLLSSSMHDVIGLKQQVEKYQQLPTPVSRREYVQRIIHTFVDERNAWKEINIPASEAATIKELALLEVPPSNIFSKAIAIVVAQMHKELSKIYLQSRHFELILSEHPELGEVVMATFRVPTNIHVAVDETHGVQLIENHVQRGAVPEVVH